MKSIHQYNVSALQPHQSPECCSQRGNTVLWELFVQLEMSHSPQCAWAPRETGHNSWMSKLAGFFFPLPVFTEAFPPPSFYWVFLVLFRLFTCFCIHWDVTRRFISCSHSSCEGISCHQIVPQPLLPCQNGLCLVYFFSILGAWKHYWMSSHVCCMMVSGESVLSCCLLQLKAFTGSKLGASISGNLWEFGSKSTSGT